MPDRSFDARNAAARERIRSLVADLGADDDARPLEGGWTPAALLGHLALWDSMVAGRWRLAARTGRLTPLDLADETADLVNDALLPTWRALNGADAAALALAAAGEVDEVLAGLPDEAIEAIEREGRPRLIDRSLHRNEHLDAIERGLG